MTNTPFFFAKPNAYRGFDFAPWGGFEGFLEASKLGGTGNGAALKRLVPDLARAVDKTAVAVASLPFDLLNEDDSVFDSSTNWKNELGGMPNPQRLFYLLASSLCGGAAYVIPTRTPKLVFDLQYCVPSTITPYIDQNGLQYFSRTTQQGKSNNYIKPKEIIYFWLPDSDVEIGPAENHPLGNATLDAQVIYNMKNTMRMYSERGFVPITLLGAKGMPGEQERQKAEGFFDRLLKGGFNVLAKIINSDALSLIRVGAGMDELKQSYIELRKDAKESIADAFGIPAGIFMSDAAFASEMDALIREWYMDSRFVSIYQTIEETFNDQLLKQYKKRLRFNPNALDVFKADETNQATTLSSLVTTVSTDAEIAKWGMGVLGYDLDNQQVADLEAIIKKKEENAKKVQEQTNGTNPVSNPTNAESQGDEVEKSMKAHENSAMIALRIPDVIKAEIQSKYPFVDEEILKDLHITLVYLGDNRTIDKLDVIRAVSDLGLFQSPIKGKLQGLARFVSDGETDPVVMTFDSPQAPKLYDALCGLLDNYHVPFHKDYGFIPHMTLAYVPKDSGLPIETIEPIEINFSEVYYVDGNVWFPVDLVGYENKGAHGLSLSADEIKDLALWYDRAKQWHAKGKGTAVDWECKHLREEIAAPIRMKLASAESETDITAAFQINQTTTRAPVYKTETIVLDAHTEAIKALAATIERGIETARVETKTPEVHYHSGNITITNPMPEQKAASVTVEPAQVVVNVPEQPAPVVNVTNEVQPTPVTVENQFSPNNDVSVNVPPTPQFTEAELTEKNGKKILKVKK